MPDALEALLPIERPVVENHAAVDSKRDVLPTLELLEADDGRLGGEDRLALQRVGQQQTLEKRRIIPVLLAVVAHELQHRAPLVTARRR